MIPNPSVWIAGVARSGTSWLGQVFNSHPNVRFRFQPLFSYEFKARVGEDSTREQFEDFLKSLWETETPFLTQADKVKSGEYPAFPKSDCETTLVFKENRYLSVIAPMLRRTPSLQVVGLIRNPCAVIHSWSCNPREFPPTAKLRDHWRFGSCKNEGPQDYFGYYKWKEVANLFLDLEIQFPDRMQVVFYDELIENLQEKIPVILKKCRLDEATSTRDFIASSQEGQSSSYYSVFRAKANRDQWQKRLDRGIIREISEDLRGTRLVRFLKQPSEARINPTRQTMVT